MTNRAEPKTKVHWNLHRDVFSVTVQGKVRSNPSAYCLRDVRFVVSSAGLARMRKLGRRKVVAWAEGTPCTCGGIGAAGVAVTFNPWKADTFVTAGTFRPVHEAQHVSFRINTTATGTRVPVTIADGAK